MRLLLLATVFGALATTTQAQLSPPCGNCSPMPDMPDATVTVAPARPGKDNSFTVYPREYPTTLFVRPDPPPEDRSWHLLQKQYNGLVSVQRGLTKHECEFAAARAMGEPATDEEKVAVAASRKAAQDDWAKWREANCKAGNKPTENIIYFCDVAVYGGGGGGGAARPVSRDEIASAECFQ
jgi:hypothetical protein